jgi:glycosyltransferase involved in cell wall biosynthesis
VARNSQVKVVITLPLAERLGGAENMLWTFLRNVDRKRLDVLVVFLERGQFEREVASIGIRTKTLPSARLRQPWAVARLILSLSRLLQRERPDVVLNWMGKSQVYGAAAASLAGMKNRIVWWQHGVAEGHWLDRLATLMPTQAVGCSSYASARAQQRMRPRRETFVVHPGIEPPQLSREVGLALRRRMSIADEAVVFGIVGRLQPWKGQDRFLTALAELRRRRHDVHGIVVGSDAYDLSPEYARYVQSLARELALAEHVHFTGQVDDALPYIAGMDALVSASAPEPFGLVLLEAMALGVPVVAVDLGGPAEIVEQNRSGLLVSRNEPQLLADALERLVQDDHLRRRLGEGARERYLDRFVAARMADSLQSKLEDLA